MSHRPIRHRIVSGSALALAVSLLAGVMVAMAAPANAAAYRYWGYFQQTGGKWAFSQVGPDQSKPKDGSVEGWRFAVADESSTRFPRALPSFADVCGSTKAQPGKKRVAVVLDYGRPSDAPAGATPPAPTAKCAVVAETGTGSAVLAAVATVRAGKGLTCAIDSYPATGCGDAVASVPAAAASPDDTVTIAPASATSTTAGAAGSQGGGLGGGAIAGIAVVVLVVGALGGLALQRSRRSGSH